MIIEKSNNNLLEECKKNPDLKLIQKKKLGRSYGVLKGIILYSFFNEKTNEIIHLGDNLTDDQLPIFNILLQEAIKQTHPNFIMDKGVVYNG